MGKITNRCTAMFDVLAKFEEGSKEYGEMKYRITCMQGYQQEIIDSCKGIIPKQVPVEWYDYKSVKEIDDKDYSLSLLANKKPYFFIYNYKHLKNELKKHDDSFENNCYLNFGVGLKELLKKENRTEEEEDFISYYKITMPVSRNNSTMNRLCWKLEEEFDNILKAIKETEFDKSILTTDRKVSNSIKNKLEEIYNEYKADVSEKIKSSTKVDKDEISGIRENFLNLYRDRIESITNDYEIITNGLVEILYDKPISKQFVWDMCGEYIISKLLKENDNCVNIPIKSDNGNIEWNGERYILTKEKVVE